MRHVFRLPGFRVLIVAMMLAAVLPIGVAQAADDVCDNDYTPIFEIQGSGGASDLVGDPVTTQGVVTADFQKSSELSAFFVQDAKGDKDPSTSDGVFVYHRDTWDFDVNVGEVVRFDAVVQERYGQTQLNYVADLVVCGTGKVKASKVILPVDSMDRWESVEGMLVDLPQKLTVSGNYAQGRYGEVDLSFNGRLSTPTNVVEPGSAAIALQDLNDRSRIQLEDGSRWSNPPWLPYFYDDPKTLRVGDTVKKKLTGVITYDFGMYELQPTVAVEFQAKNPRPDGPPKVKGDVKVASFNVLNFFTTIDSGPDVCGPTGLSDCRGADSVAEYERQLAKILAGIIGLGADVIGFQEIENDIHPEDVDGSRAHDAILTLVEELNEMEGAGTWAWIGEPTPVVLGDPGMDPVVAYNDYPVRNEIIYRTATVAPVEGALTLQDIAFNATRPGEFEPVGRPPLAQTFVANASGEVFTVVTNHFKSKGSSCDSLEYGGVSDVDTGDGQGNCNLTRVAQADALVGFVEYLAGEAGDPDVLAIGDLNSYAMEDPISTLSAAGYTDLIAASIPKGKKHAPDTYQFFGQSGYLDSAFATSSLVRQVRGTAVWHINAEEPNGLDYNTYNQSALYAPDEFRSSDHNPVIVGLRLR